MPSPSCQVKDGAGSYQATTSGVDVTTGNTVTINLISSAGVNTWSIQCITTDDESDAATVNASLTIDPVAKTATFTAPVAGRAYRFQSQINSGYDNGVWKPSYTTTFCVYTLTVGGRRVHAVDETFESDATFGWLGGINDLIRNPSGSSTPTGTGFRHVTSGVEDAAAQKVNLTSTADVTSPSGTGFFHISGGAPQAAAKLVENADVHASAAIALSKLAAGATNGNIVRQSGGALSLGTVSLSDSNSVTGQVPTANGGTGQNWGASSGIPKLTTGTASLVTAPTGALVGDSDSQTLTNKTLTSPTLGGTVTLSSTAIQATGNARARAYSNIANVQTTDATVTTLFSWTILDEATTKVTAEVCANSSTGASTASYVRQVHFKRDGGTVTAGTVDASFTAEDVSAWDTTIDNSTSTGRSRVTGAAGTTVDWGGVISRLEVSHA